MAELENDKIQRYEKLLSGISKATLLLLNSDDFDLAVSNALKILGESAETCRTYLFTVNTRDDVEELKYSHEWVYEGIEPQINNPKLSVIKVSDAADSLDVLKSGQIFKAIVDEMPADSQTASYLKIQGIKSVLMVPVFVRKEFFGFVGYYSCREARRWTDVEVDLLISFSAALAKAQENHSSRRALNDTNRLLRLVTENAKDIIALISAEGKYRYISPSIKDVLGYTREELKLLPGDKFLPDDTVRLIVQELLEKTDEDVRPSKTFTHRAIHKAGNSVYLETKITVIKEEINGEISMQIISRDVTEKLLLEKDKEINRKKERELINLRSLFVSMASHQFRTPLTVIQSNLDLITVTLERAGFPRGAEQILNEAIARVKGQITNMTDLMSDMLLLGEFQERGLKVNREVFSLKALVDEIIKEIRIADYNAHHFDVEGFDVAVFADKTLIKHAIVNLLENACKYSGEGSTIQLKYGSDQNKNAAYFVVKDEGIGIKEEDLKSITSTFFRGKNVGNRKGTGLGLAIVKEFIGVHEGDLEVTSKINKGTTVTITFPHNKKPER